MMEGQFFFTTIAGLAVSIAGFAALIAWLREDARTWDPINLWRVKTIVQQAFTIAFLALILIPIFALTNDMETTIRLGSVGLLVYTALDVFKNRHPDPEIWVPHRTWTFYLVFSILWGALQLVNIWVASLGILQIGFLLELSSPAGIFYNFVRELGRNPSPVEPEVVTD
jgi:hypothetical protein